MPSTDRKDRVQFYGHVERCSANRLSGWAWNPEKPTEREIVDILVNRQIVMFVIADKFRDDLKAAGIGDGQFGFEVSSFPYGPEDTVEVVARSTGISLKISDPFFRNVSHAEDAHAEGASKPPMASDGSGTLEPVAIINAPSTTEPTIVYPPANPESQKAAAPVEVPQTKLKINVLLTPEFDLVGAVAKGDGDFGPPKVTLLVDGQAYAESYADKPVVAALSKDTASWAGFLFQLPGPPSTSFYRKLRVVSGNGEAELSVDYRERYGGHFERYEFADKKVRIAGWAQDKAMEFTPISVVVTYDGQHLATIRADKTRPDLQKARIGMGNHSFDSIISCDIGAFDIGKMKVVYSGTDIPLPRHRLEQFNVTNSILCQTTDPKNGIPRSDQVIGFQLTRGESSKAHGHIDTITAVEIRGWAYNPDNPDQPVELDFLIDGQLVASTRTNRFRADLAQKFGSSGYHGFSFEVLPQYAQVAWRTFAVSIRRGSMLGNGAQNVQLLPAHVALMPPPPRTVFSAKKRPKVDDPVTFSLIVLNLNGAELLREFFRTLERFERNVSFEVIIVDHGSTDDSAKVCESYAFLNAKFLPRGRNFSFSESNNYGANLARGEILICLNNDIFWCQSVLDEIATAFADPAVGCVGIQLLDTPISQLELSPPIVQTIGIHFNFHLRDRAIHPVETRFDSTVADAYFGNSDAPGVTGAFLSMRAKDFAAVGGFDEGYNYGYEDVDLCLKVVFDLNLKIECRNAVRAFHHRGYSRKKSDKWAGSNMVRNRQRLERNFAYRVRRDMLGNVFDRAPFWQGRVLVIAFVVTEASNTTAAGDFFTAAEFGESLQSRLGARVIFLEEKKNWYDVLGVDILIVMRHEYRLDLLENKKSTLITIGWARNWFEKWVEAPSARDYNLLAASGDQAVAYMIAKLRRPVFKLNIATNASRFSPDETVAKVYDVVFSGNFWGHPREIAYMFRPDAFSGTFKAFGAGWELVPNWASHSEGLKAYGELPSIYRQTRIVLDDANSVTKEWGSVNSRVYDAIAAGCLVVTNGRRGAEAEFGGLLPSYESTHELHDTLNKYLNNDDLFEETRKLLRSLVLEKHTYENRVDELTGPVTAGVKLQRRFAIKIGAPSKTVASAWGDYHFAESLKSALLELGHVARIDCLDSWEGSAGYGDDCVIVLRGLSIYKAKSYQCNILWIISHPDLVSIAECESYDLVFTASEKHKKYLNEQGVPAEALLQCTDQHLFSKKSETQRLETDQAIFVGNTRNVYRPIVKHAIENDLDFRVVGEGWRDFIPGSYVIADYAPNDTLPDLYGSAKFVLNDHWQSMRTWGFISNRVFDVVASGAPCLSDYVEGIEHVFGGAVVTYDDKTEFGDAVKRASRLRENAALLAEASERVVREHTFQRRAEQILEKFGLWENSVLTPTSDVARVLSSNC